eukprot:CAMPEP_0117047218 /NCGR_PEP_ID=MMETSP0472-20121206/32639_1 /TAXON_ID=693140 ORGANISM="Tiarina fusus, Strain LIS" /NCGR_SAMPLE_ID=MMETSP0472 /ASSEMBLY_ACC=CAM_ASM_000603 /LENGTH=57 /DNA_ID=CAMNT_0004759849 /DNA_START=441 /DNA_END=614 /DNA_ORIENTATION=+
MNGSNLWCCPLIFAIGVSSISAQEQSTTATPEDSTISLSAKETVSFPTGLNIMPEND